MSAKRIITLIAIVCISVTAYSQAYVKLGTGYHIGINQDVVGTTTTDSNSIVNEFGSFGAGLPIDLGLGIDISDNIGLELGFQYFMGSKVVTDEISNSGGITTLKEETYSRQMRLRPAVVLSSDWDVINLYSRAGLNIPFGGATTVESTWTTTAGNDFTQKGEAKGRLAIGFDGAIGTNVALGDNLSLYLELASTNMRIKGDSYEIIERTRNGDDNLDMAYPNTISKSVNFVDELTSSSNNTAAGGTLDVDKPLDALTSSSNYNSLGLNIGIKLSF